MAKKTLTALHDKLSQVLLDAIQDGVVVLDKEGAALKVTAPAAILNVARQFLKDNNIDCDPVPDSAFGKLAKLPEFDDELEDAPQRSFQ